MAISQSNKEALKNPWALGILIFIAFFLVSNAVFIYLAFKTAPNLVVTDYYERGEQFKELQDAMEKQTRLGWQATLLTPAQIKLYQKQTFEFIIRDKHSSALDLSSVTLHAYRPSDAEADFSQQMKETSPSHYQAELMFPLRGSWDVIVKAQKGTDEFLLTKRIHIVP
jgi:nitrogen fixation protein FixH